MLLEQGLLFELELLASPLIVSIAFGHDILKVGLELIHRNLSLSNLIDTVIFFSSLNHFACLSAYEKNRLRDVDRTAHIGTVWSSSKFLNEPAVILFFINKVVSFLELHRVVIFDSLDFFHDAFLEVLAIGL